MCVRLGSWPGRTVDGPICAPPEAGGMTRTRRSLLAGATATAAAVAGCLGGDSDDAESFDDHPATTDIGTQPTLSVGAPATIVAFEDPSCRSCRRFETETFPQLRSELIAPGDVTFVYRTLDITFPWAEPAAQVMAATYAADADAFWGLKEFYYDEQPAFEDAGDDEVSERSRTYLEAESPVDADAVVAAARDAEHDGFLQRNRDAAGAADVEATPEFFLFRDGAFRTSVSGPQGYEFFAAALGFES